MPRAAGLQAQAIPGDHLHEIAARLDSLDLSTPGMELLEALEGRRAPLE